MKYAALDIMVEREMSGQIISQSENQPETDGLGSFQKTDIPECQERFPWGEKIFHKLGDRRPSNSDAYQDDDQQ